MYYIAECKLCKDKTTSDFDSLDRLTSFKKKNILVKRIDAGMIDVGITHVPYVIFRPKEQYFWFEHKETKTQLIKDMLR